MNHKWMGTGAALLMAALVCVFAPPCRAQAAPPVADVNGSWSAKMTSPMGEMEIVYKLVVKDGKITGTAVMPFGESPIIDGAIDGDKIHFTVQMNMMGNTMKAEAKGKIVGDTLVLTPAMPSPPDGGDNNGQGGPGGANTEPLVFHRQA